jgi:protein-S-isoprenylcysteine O-methyltransferase Ste14
MRRPGKTLCERLRISITWIYTLCIAVLAIFGESRYQTSLLGKVLFTLGGSLAAVGAFGRLWCSLYISGYKNNTLISEGPYSLCRNPLYFFSFIGALGIGFSTGNFTVPVLIFAGFAIYYPMVVSGEEARLTVLHGERFQSYRQSTPAFFPRFAAFRESGEYVVRPKIFRKDICDAIWFIWAVCILQLIAALRALTYIPTLFNLY